MNYIQQIRALDDFKLYKTRLSSGEIALWHALMSINNKTGWQEWFTAANSMLVSLSGLSRSGILKDRNVLKQLGLIDFKTNGKRATSYHVCVLYTLNSTQDSKHQSKQDSTHDSKQDSNTLNKLNQTKHKPDEEDARTNSPNPIKDRQDILQVWQQLWGFPNPIAQQDLDTWIADFGTDIVYLAIWYAGKKNVLARSADTWLDRTFEDWHKQKVNTVAKAKQAIKSHEERNSTAKGGYAKQRVNTKETMPKYSQPPEQKELTPEQQDQLDKQLAALKRTEEASS